MIPGYFKIASRSISFYRKQVSYQVLIILILSAVITGSLLTGSSVRNSLKRSASIRLGNTGVVASSGLRFMSRELPARLKENGIQCTGLLETRGSITTLNTQRSVNNVSIFAVEGDFFSFQG